LWCIPGNISIVLQAGRPSTCKVSTVDIQTEKFQEVLEREKKVKNILEKEFSYNLSHFPSKLEVQILILEIALLVIFLLRILYCQTFKHDVVTKCANESKIKTKNSLKSKNLSTKRITLFKAKL
jgi:hypothetical protein